MALGRTQPLTEMSTRSISWGYRRPVRKADNLPTSCAFVTKSGNLNLLEPSGPLQACNGPAFIWQLHTNLKHSFCQHYKGQFHSSSCNVQYTSIVSSHLPLCPKNYRLLCGVSVHILFIYLYISFLLFCTTPNKCTNISQIITLLLHVSTLSCHPQGVCNQ